MSALANVSMLPRNHTDLQIGVAVFASVTATVPTKQDQVRWGDVVESLVEPCDVRKKKDELRLFKLATFSGGRNNDNVKTISGVIADYDAGKVPVAQAVALLRAASIEAVVYTTPSHTPQAPRWRVVVPLSRAYGPETHAHFVSLMNGVLGGVLSPESWVLSQIYYVGRIEGVDFDAVHIPGDLIDELDDCELLPEPIGKPGAGPINQPVVDDALVQMERATVLASATSETMAELASALDYIAEFTDRTTEYTAWIATGEALASLKSTEYAAVALELWHRFSATDPRYDQAQTQEKWGGFDPNEITYKSVFEWAQAAGWKNPKAATPRTLIDWTDQGNANLLYEMTAGDLRYLIEQKRWMIWNGSRWFLDPHGAHAHEQALRVSAHYVDKLKQLKSFDPGDDAAREKNAAMVKELQKWIRACRNRDRIASMLHCLSMHPDVVVSVNDLDRDPLKLGVQNGVVDLRTGELLQAARKDFVTKFCTVEYDPSAKAPGWEKFVAEITGEPIPAEFNANGDVLPGTVGRYKPRLDVANFLQRGSGYIATGLTVEQVMVILLGVGANGKNAFADTLQSILGDYAVTVPVETLMAARYASDGDRATPTVARLPGMRAVFCSEVRPEQRLDTTTIKSQTGDEFLAARALHQPAFQFKKSHKLVMLGNHAPKFDHDDRAVWGRILQVDFKRCWNRPGDVTADPTRPNGDKGLMARLLKEEGQGILAWIVRGAMAYIRDGLCVPADVKNSTRQYLLQQSRVAQWLADWEACEPKQGTRASMLFADYQQSTGDRTTSQTAFSKELTMLGVAKASLESGSHYGLRRAGGFP